MLAKKFYGFLFALLVTVRREHGIKHLFKKVTRSALKVVWRILAARLERESKIHCFFSKIHSPLTLFPRETKMFNTKLLIILFLKLSFLIIEIIHDHLLKFKLYKNFQNKTRMFLVI